MFRNANNEPEGINRTIYCTISNSSILEEFELIEAKNDIKYFLSEAIFENRREKAILISKKALGRHGKEKTLKPFLERLADIEIGVQQYNPVLRDHSTHQVYVFLLGLLFIQRLKLIRIIDPLSWKISSLLHDVGYPLQLFSSSIKDYISLLREYKAEISNIRTQFGYSISLTGLEHLKFSDKDAFDIIENRLREWDINLNLRRIHSCYLKQGKINHGILSALIVLNLIDSLYAKYNPEREEHKKVYGIDWGKRCFDTQILNAVSAISLHDLLDRINIIHFEKSPLAYLLVLCDNLQQWDRYSLGQRTYDPFSIDIKFENKSIICKLLLPKRRIREIRNAIKKLQSKTWQLKVSSLSGCSR